MRATAPNGTPEPAGVATDHSTGRPPSTHQPATSLASEVLPTPAWPPSTTDPPAASIRRTRVRSSYRPTRVRATDRGYATSQVPPSKNPWREGTRWCTLYVTWR
jgi:hypothetical protein